MDNQRRWIPYDTFKLIIALILLAVFLILTLQRPPVPQSSGTGQTNPAAAGNAVQATNTPLAAAVLPTNTAAAPTLPVTPTQLAVMATATLPEPTPTLAPQSEATATPTLAVEPTETPTPAAEANAQTEPTATPQASASSEGCPLAQPARLSVGKQAQVTSNLNLRKEAGMDKQIDRVLVPNAKLDVIGGPVCIPFNDKAYLWWNVKTADGAVGWSAEASLTSNFYFLQPIP